MPATDTAIQWPQVTGQAAADMIGCSAPWLRKLELQGYLERKENGFFDLSKVLLGYIRWLRDADRRAEKSAPCRDLVQARTLQLKIENDKRSEALIETELAEKFASESMARMRQVFLTLEPVRDPDLEARFKERLRNAIEQAEVKSTVFFASIRAQRPTVVDDEASDD